VTPEQNSKIDAGVASCLDHCHDPTRLFTSVSSFVKKLKANQGWTDEELSELQIRVIRILLKRHDEGERI
jgi:hypothetical protein